MKDESTANKGGTCSIVLFLLKMKNGLRYWEKNDIKCCLNVLLTVDSEVKTSAVSMLKSIEKTVIAKYRLQQLKC